MTGVNTGCPKNTDTRENCASDSAAISWAPIVECEFELMALLVKMLYGPRIRKAIARTAQDFFSADEACTQDISSDWPWKSLKPRDTPQGPGSLRRSI